MTQDEGRSEPDQALAVTPEQVAEVQRAAAEMTAEQAVELIGGLPPDQEQLLSVRVYWETADQIPVLYANHIWVRILDGQFHVTFGQAEGPYENPVSEATMAKLVESGAAIHPVAKLAISPMNMGRMIKVLNDLFNRWEKDQGDGEQP